MCCSATPSMLVSVSCSSDMSNVFETEEVHVLFGLHVHAVEKLRGSSVSTNAAEHCMRNRASAA